MIKISKVLLHVLPGGRIPERQTDGAVGYDVYARAIVSAHTMDPENPNLRQSLFDFKNPPFNPDVVRHVMKQDFNEGNGDELIYLMDPGESVLVGIGFITAMSFPMFYWVAPRSGLASKWGITVTNAPGTVDPDYRGEAGVLVYNRNETPFALRCGMRIAQIIFQRALMPEIETVDRAEDLPITSRGPGGFGSTGLQ